ncbi:MULTISPECIES: GroES family chaperonin [Parachlamydia]|jgi:chaperonin GroES|uniref:Co-chaperonin GroES n=2 Tax=Parachlamydia acanthamoebae TaxID=83552 RepID=F8KVM2_PARAV|nr:co-chaperone GroES [Parachlamydia acanthamoebae]EFB42224.1 Co-chaperonin GroES [Parachlamydia acanthamoebae str. Hall's coccus]CCB85158.1 10 kDa chaperonin [Parachlamydia acanthamoebae UV-7]
MANIQPLADRVLVKRTKASTSKGGILLPDSAQEKPKEGIVVAVGPGKINENGRHEPVSLEVGARVLFSSYAGTEVKSPKDEETYLILNADDILGVFA